MRVLPDRFAGCCIESEHIIGTLDGVENPIHHDGSHFMLLERTRLKDPAQLEIASILRSDLRQRTVALAVETTGVGEPVLRLIISAQDPFEWNGFCLLYTSPSPRDS